MKYLMLLLLIFPLYQMNAQDTKKLQGAWGNEEVTITFSGDYFSYAAFTVTDKSFKGTKGGLWLASDGKINMKYEFNTWESEQVGREESQAFSLKKNKLILGDKEYKRIDDGSPGSLQGAWLITERMRNGEMREMRPGARKTMKILSGTRFQWIAYNTETKEFMGTGGGNYSTKDGKYVENIEFFSRDNSRVGASLSFNFELKEGKWHHSGKSSKGNLIYEIWSLREE